MRRSLSGVDGITILLQAKVQIDPIAPDGLIWAVFCRPGQAPQAATSETVSARLAGAALPEPGWLWLHFDVVAQAPVKRINGLDWLPEDAREALTRHDAGLQLEAEDDLVFGSLPGFDDALSEQDKEVFAWRFALLPDLLITTRRRPVPALYLLQRELLGGKSPLPGPAALVDRALLAFGDHLRRDIGLLDDELDRAEDVLLAAEENADLGEVGGIVGKARRRSTLLRRVIAPMDRIMNHEELVLPEWADDELLDGSRRQLRAALDDLLALQDRARSLQDELAARQAEETNRRLYLVSIMTALMLPMTFVTGFFGMNTSGMFLTAGHSGTIWAGIVCLVFMSLTWLFLKRSRML